MSTSSTWLSTARTPAFCHFRIVFHLSPQRFRKLSTETALQSLCPHPAFCLGKPAHPVQNPARMCGGTFFFEGERSLMFYRRTFSFLLQGNDFFSSKKKRRGRFLFLKKRNKRHCGIDDQSEKRCFPARPAWNGKTDGSYVNRPFCAARWRKRQEHRRKAAPQLIFFCFFSSKKKRRRFVCEPSVLCSALGKTAGAQGGNCSADDFLLLLFF